MWGELSKSVKAVLYDRISSPLLGTFAVSWVLWNHRFITVLLSNMEPIEKFKVVDTVLYSTWDSLLWKMAAFPLLTTALFNFLISLSCSFRFRIYAQASETPERDPPANRGRDPAYGRGITRNT